MFSLITGYKDFILRKPAALPRVARGIVNRALLGRPYLRVVEIATTFICNSRCVMCSCAKLLDAAKEEARMGAGEYRILGEQLDALGCASVNVTGGEPLVRGDIREKRLRSGF